jgi:hypothetical protein
MRAQAWETRILKRIESKRGDVFLRDDFCDLGGYDQVGRVLRELVRKGQLLKVGYGVYTRAVKLPFIDKFVPKNGLMTLKEALEPTVVETAPSRLEGDYTAGKTTQVPDRPHGCRSCCRSWARLSQARL